eukprot:TRINITY_DN1844_c0_g1_i1.p1 TRINITY_DN1844_c0_g1~~TRINITY_DN1844_c0_g1_i1.p1  ORF type:complete len:1009 (+),score=296.92 TRINITY_DN1844_c0_g1_i1:150-3176(+)
MAPAPVLLMSTHADGGQKSQARKSIAHVPQPRNSIALPRGPPRRQSVAVTSALQRAATASFEASSSWTKSGSSSLVDVGMRKAIYRRARVFLAQTREGEFLHGSHFGGAGGGCRWPFRDVVRAVHRATALTMRTARVIDAMKSAVHDRLIAEAALRRQAEAEQRRRMEEELRAKAARQAAEDEERRLQAELEAAQAAAAEAAAAEAAKVEEAERLKKEASLKEEAKRIQLDSCMNEVFVELERHDCSGEWSKTFDSVKTLCSGIGKSLECLTDMFKRNLDILADISGDYEQQVGKTSALISALKNELMKIQQVLEASAEARAAEEAQQQVIDSEILDQRQAAEARVAAALAKRETHRQLRAKQQELLAMKEQQQEQQKAQEAAPPPHVAAMPQALKAELAKKTRLMVMKLEDMEQSVVDDPVAFASTPQASAAFGTLVEQARSPINAFGSETGEVARPRIDESLARQEGERADGSQTSLPPAEQMRSPSITSLSSDPFGADEEAAAAAAVVVPSSNHFGKVTTRVQQHALNSKLSLNTRTTNHIRRHSTGFGGTLAGGEADFSAMIRPGGSASPPPMRRSSDSNVVAAQRLGSAGNQRTPLPGRDPLSPRGGSLGGGSGGGCSGAFTPQRQVSGFGGDASCPAGSSSIMRQAVAKAVAHAVASTPLSPLSPSSSTWPATSSTSPPKAAAPRDGLLAPFALPSSPTPVSPALSGKAATPPGPGMQPGVALNGPTRGIWRKLDAASDMEDTWHNRQLFLKTQEGNQRQQGPPGTKASFPQYAAGLGQLAGNGTGPAAAARSNLPRQNGARDSNSPTELSSPRSPQHCRPAPPAPAGAAPGNAGGINLAMLSAREHRTGAGSAAAAAKAMLDSAAAPMSARTHGAPCRELHAPASPPMPSLKSALAGRATDARPVEEMGAELPMPRRRVRFSICPSGTTPPPPEETVLELPPLTGRQQEPRFTTRAVPLSQRAAAAGPGFGLGGAAAGGAPGDQASPLEAWQHFMAHGHLS